MAAASCGEGGQEQRVPPCACCTAVSLRQHLLTVAMVTGSVALLALGSAARRLCGCAGAAGQSHVTPEGGQRGPERARVSRFDTLARAPLPLLLPRR